MSNSDHADNLSDLEETNIDEAVEPDEESGLVAERTGYSSDEFEEDAEDDDSEVTLPASAAEVECPGTEEDTDPARHSPFVPDNPSTPPPTGRDAAPPQYSATVRVGRPAPKSIHPPPYTRGAGAASGIELQNVTRETPKPPSYDAAVARTTRATGRQAETSFGPGVATSYVSDIPTSGDVPPPTYSAVGQRRESGAEAVSDTEVDVEGGQPEPAPGSPDASAGLFTQIRQSIRNRERLSLSGSTRRAVIITSIVICCLLMFVILFPFQFSYVDYYQFALVRTKSTGRVSTDRVYEHGCYVLGADKEFVYLERVIQPIEFTQLSMFTKDNVDLSIDVKLYYYLKYDDIGQLWRDYAGKHETVITAAAKTTIRNCAARASQDDYLSRREYVEQLIHDALKDKFAGWGIDVPHFYYLNLHLPSRILEKKLKLLLIRTDIEKEQAYQLQRQVELETELLTTPVIYLAKEAINNGTAQAAAIDVIANTEKNKYVDIAHMNAFDAMMDTLNVTAAEHALSFYYLATLNTMDHFGGVIEYTKRGLYTPSNT